MTVEESWSHGGVGMVPGERNQVASTASAIMRRDLASRIGICRHGERHLPGLVMLLMVL